MCQAPQKATVAAFAPHVEESFDDSDSSDGGKEDFSWEPKEATNSFAAQTVVPKAPPQILRASSASSEDSESSEESVEASSPAAEEKVMTTPGEESSRLPASGGHTANLAVSTAQPSQTPAVSLNSSQQAKPGMLSKSAVRPIAMRLRDPVTREGSDVVIKKHTATSQHAMKSLAKPTLIQVAPKKTIPKDNDLFAELDMNAEFVFWRIGIL